MSFADKIRLFALTMVHFTVDFYGGLTIPLPEPTLTEHLNADIAIVAFIIGISAIVINAIQPIIGWVLPQKGSPIILLIGPLLAALIAFIGLSQSAWIVGLLLITAAVGIGIIHPEGSLVAHSLSGKNKGLGMSLFMAGGYFGFSFGGLLSGYWAENYGLNYYWVLSILSVFTALLVYFSGLFRFHGTSKTVEPQREALISFKYILPLSVCVAVNMSILVRFYTIFLVRKFPHEEAQSYGGMVIFTTGIFGVLGSILLGYMSRHFSVPKLIAFSQLLSVPFLYQLFHIESIQTTPYWACGVGLTLCSVFPLTIVLAKQSYGLSDRLRMGLTIGGAWGIGEAVFILGGKYISFFQRHELEPVHDIFSIIWFLLFGTLCCLFLIDRGLKKADIAFKENFSST